MPPAIERAADMFRATRRLFQGPSKFNPLLMWVRKTLLPYRVMHISGPLTVSYGPDEFIVICVMRNGESHIKSFLSHHRSLGVKHFVFLDNGSTDRSLALLSNEADVTVLQSAASYHVYENEMKAYLAQKYCMERWCLCADIDELFDYPYSKDVSLSRFIRYLQSRGFNAVITQVLDMFSDLSLSELTSSPDDDLREKYPYYDISQISKTPFDKRIMAHHGGIRSQVFGTQNGLTKVSLFRMDGQLVPFVRWHNASNAKIADVSCVLLHFPFVASFRDKVRDAVATGRYGFLVDSEYAAYHRGLTKSSELSLKLPSSHRLASVDELLARDFLVASEQYATLRSTPTNQDKKPVNRGKPPALRSLAGEEMR